MAKIILQSLNSTLARNWQHLFLFFFRVALSMELVLVHGSKKIGATAEIVPNPFGLPESINQGFAIAGTLVFPFFVAAGIFTRIATLPILAVPLTGYFVVHINDSLELKDGAFIYALSFMAILFFGPGKYSIDQFMYHKIRKYRYFFG